MLAPEFRDALHDAFNLANAATVLARTVRQDTSTGNFATTILAPRVVRLGVKVNF